MRHARILAVALLLAANVIMTVVFWWSVSGPLLAEAWAGGQPAIALGRLAGLLLQIGLLIQLVLIGRVVFIERDFGFDGLNRIHRLLGYTLAVLLVAHPLLLSVGYGILSERTMPDAFLGLIIGFEEVLPATVGAVILLGVVAASVPWARRRLRYESWHAVHLATYLALWLSFEHQVESGGDFVSRPFFVYWYALNGAVVGLYVCYRFFRPFALWLRHRFVVQRVVQETPDVFSVYITGRAMDRFRYEGGQYANLYLMSRSLWSGHPFSFSREYDGKTLRFSIKQLGDATALIGRLTPGVPVLIDGPLGIFTASRVRSKSFLLIGGGIGITPLRAIAGDLAGSGVDIVSLIGARTSTSAALFDELRTLSRVAVLYLSEPTANPPTRSRTGHIDAAAIREFAPDVAEREVFVCGPPPMMDAVIAVLRRMGVPRKQIHAERFGY